MPTNCYHFISRTLAAACRIALLLTLAGPGRLCADTLREPRIDQVNISLVFKDLPLGKALREIEQASNFTFVYNKAHVDEARRVTLTAANESVARVLGRLFSGTKVQFKQLDSNIILSASGAKQAAPAGTVEGRLTDYETGEALVGATILVEGTSHGDAADAEGQFRIGNVPEGVHTLSFSYIGYQTAQVPGVEVKAGTVTRVNYKLVPTNNTLGEVVVRAEITPENTTERLLVESIRNSRTIISGISNEQIVRSLDFDAGEVVRRVSGVTLVNGRFVMIRGLDPRYTLTLLNDMITPSSESDRKSFSYDMINSSTIDRIIISKSPAPELPGDFAGGVVKVYTKSFANARQLQIQLSGQFRPGSSFADHYTYKGGKYDKLGFDDGSRNLPAGLPAKRDFPNPESADPADQAANANLARQFSNNWNLGQRFQNVDKRAVVNYFDAWNIGKTRLASLTSLSYWLTGDFRRVTRQVGAIIRDTIFLGENPLISIPVPGQSALDSIYTETARLSAMQNFRWTLGERHTLEFRNFFNQLGQDQTLVREFRSSDNGDKQYFESLNKGLQYNFRSRSLYTGLLSGEHQLGKSSVNRLSWRAGYARTTEKVPDQRRYGVERQDSLAGFSQYLPTDAAGFRPYLPGHYRWAASDGNATTDARVYTWLKESAYTASADAERNLGRLTLKTGWFSDYRKRSYDTRVYVPYVNNVNNLAEDLRPLASLDSDGVPGLDRNGERVFNPRNFRPDGSGWDFEDNSGFGSSASYTAANEQHAGYLAVNLPLLGKRLNVYGGVRAEWNRLQSFGAPYPVSRDPGDGSTIVYDSLPVSTQQRLYWLPSLNVSYQFTPRLLARAAYGKTLNRPEFREIGPVTYYDFEKAAYYYGNVTLTNAEVQNLDLRLEWYPTEDELLSVGAFYKDLHNPIEAVSAAQANFANDAITYLNTSRAEVYGLEAEIRKRLDFIPLPGFRYLSVIANATWLRSKVVLSDSVRFLSSDFRERPLQGSAPYTVNAGVYYDNENQGTQVSVLYNVLGKRVTAAATSYNSFALYELPRHVVDLTITQRVTRFLRVKAGVQDLLNQPYRFFRDVIPDKQFRPDYLSRGGELAGGEKLSRWTSDYLEERYRPGSYFSLGVLMTF